jgi:hypothetical protein
VAVLILSTIMLIPCERRIFLIRIRLSGGVQEVISMNNNALW